MFIPFCSRISFVLFVICSSSVFSFQLDSDALDGFATELSKNHNFDRGEVRDILNFAEGSKAIVRLMSRPAEKTKPWGEYKKIFLTSKKLEQGCKFLSENKNTLIKARRVYGVPESVITAIIGIETIYGANTGNYRLLDSLPTLAFHYPGGNSKREKFFRYQLTEFFLLAKEEGFDMRELRGSYAGAIGIPQFMPNNVRKLAVDFDGDGKKDIRMSREDAIGSVGNYLKHHGWQRDGLVYLDAKLKEGYDQKIKTNTAKLATTIGALDAFTFDASNMPDKTRVSIVKFKEEGVLKHRIVFENFYAIFRYNPRVKYALVVALLASSLQQECDLMDL